MEIKVEDFFVLISIFEKYYKSNFPIEEAISMCNLKSQLDIAYLQIQEEYKNIFNQYNISNLENINDSIKELSEEQQKLLQKDLDDFSKKLFDIQINTISLKIKNLKGFIISPLDIEILSPIINFI